MGYFQVDLLIFCGTSTTLRANHRNVRILDFNLGSTHGGHRRWMDRIR